MSLCVYGFIQFQKILDNWTWQQVDPEQTALLLGPEWEEFGHNWMFVCSSTSCISTSCHVLKKPCDFIVILFYEFFDSMFRKTLIVFIQYAKNVQLCMCTVCCNVYRTGHSVFRITYFLAHNCVTVWFMTIYSLYKIGDGLCKFRNLFECAASEAFSSKLFTIN